MTRKKNDHSVYRPRSSGQSQMFPSTLSLPVGADHTRFGASFFVSLVWLIYIQSATEWTCRCQLVCSAFMFLFCVSVSPCLHRSQYYDSSGLAPPNSRSMSFSMAYFSPEQQMYTLPLSPKEVLSMFRAGTNFAPMSSPGSYSHLGRWVSNEDYASSEEYLHASYHQPRSHTELQQVLTSADIVVFREDGSQQSQERY